MSTSSVSTSSVTARGPVTGTRPDAGPRATLAAAVLAFFVITLDATIVNVALPSIRGDLGGGIAGLQWVVDGYTLMFAALLLSAGALSDRIGAKRALAAGLALFLLGSLACGLAPSLAVLVAARFVQGAGAAMVTPASMAMIRHAYADPAARARAVGMWAMGGAVAAAAGPVLGGLLSLATWRLIFLINLPVGAVTLLLLTRAARSPHHSHPFDRAGQLTAMIAMSGLTYGAIDAGTAGLTAPRVLAAFAVAAVAFVGFGLVQARARHPMMPLKLFRSRTFDVTVAIGFAFMVGFYGAPFLFSLYFQQVRGLSPLGAGAAFVPMMAISACLTPFSARIAERVGPRIPIVAGLLCAVAGALTLAAVPAHAPVWLLAVLLIPVGLSGPLVMPPTTAVMLAHVPAHRAGTASGVFNTSRQVGGALAVAVCGALLGGASGFLPGLRTSLVITAVVTLAAAAAALLLRPMTREA
ncbi:DHA2 family efflux MFS transporter permease subunit [Georgenia ruanii]|uniref:DHA2 family efflux MFS transporter permease subunit n=1 Tax=Georgenia ruanii TaxID=348442 RepID=A0A7J9UX12_9MICO|nr:DHA2 family efflux MFS transporter permease subunit [Georgenia ruanii]MPV89158.1 DHA2 family efflux MFS transporter permease subunit [Georgenia ruanii]